MSGASDKRRSRRHIGLQTRLDEARDYVLLNEVLLNEVLLNEILLNE